MSTDLFVLVGAGGHAKVVYEALRAAALWPVIEVRDDAPPAPDAFFQQSVQAPAIPLNLKPGVAVHVAIGRNDVRQALSHRLVARHARLTPVVHPRACVSSFAVVGDGTFIAANAILAPAARVEQGCIINHGAIVDHDCTIGPWCHIAPGAVLGGAVVIGSRVLIGAGAVVLPGVRVADGASVGAGAVVTRDVAPGVVVVGVPGRARAIEGSRG